MPNTLKMCTWNVQLGLALSKVLESVRRLPDFEGLDLLALQEASVHNGEEDARVVAAALGPQYDCYQVQAHVLRGRPQANAMIWNAERVRIDQRASVLLPSARQVSLSRRERALLRALPVQGRLSLALEGTFGSERLRVYVAHLDVVGFAHKREQFEHILNAARALPPAEVTIVAGDFNTFRFRSRPSWSNLAEAARAEGFVDLTSDIVWTHMLGRLPIRQKLDAILVRRSAPFQYRSWTLDIPGSDHIPVFAELSLNFAGG